MAEAALLRERWEIQYIDRRQRLEQETIPGNGGPPPSAIAVDPSARTAVSIPGVTMCVPIRSIPRIIKVNRILFLSSPILKIFLTLSKIILN